MTRSNIGILFALPLLCLSWLTPLAVAAKNEPDHWVGTWASSPVAGPNADRGIGTADITYREIVHVSLGGSLARIVLSNEFGTEPLTIGAAHIALSAGHGEISL